MLLLKVVECILLERQQGVCKVVMHKACPGDWALIGLTSMTMIRDFLAAARGDLFILAFSTTITDMRGALRPTV